MSGNGFGKEDISRTAIPARPYAMDMATINRLMARLQTISDDKAKGKITFQQANKKAVEAIRLMYSKEQICCMVSLIILSALSLTALVHYARLSIGRMSRMPDEKSRSDLFNYRLMTVVSLLVLSVSVGSIIVYGSSLK